MFDHIIDVIAKKFGLTEKQSGGLLHSLLQMIIAPNGGGLSGFVDMFRNAGLGNKVDSWISGSEPQELTPDEVKAALGSDRIAGIAKDAGVDENSATAALGSMIPQLIDSVTPDGSMPDNEGFLAKIGNFLSDWGAAIGGAVAGGVGAAAAMAGDAAEKVSDAADAAVTKGKEAVSEGVAAVTDAAGSAYNKVSGAVSGAADKVEEGAGSILTWLIPLLLLGLLIVLGYWFCGRGTTTVPTNANANANRAANANANTAATVDSQFKIVAKDGKYVVTGIVPDQKTLDEIKAKLEAQFGAGNVDLSGLKVDAKAKPFAAGWWDNFAKMLPNLKDWKDGSLAFAGGAITEAVGLPSAALDQLRSLFSGWKMPESLANAAAEVEKKLAEVTLPNGTKLSAYPGGIEDQLVKFIQSDEYKSATNDQLKDRWFNFDDLNFVFGKNELTPESKRQLDNIVAILKAFPDVKIKIGGYTDKKGDDAANLKLSDARAKAVQAALQKAGVGAQVPEAEGYGEKFATVDENASDEERKVDRKTAIRLIK